jgi:hypothetical protein
MRFARRGNAGRVSDVHHLCVQLGRPELASTNDGHLHVERSAVGPYGPHTAEVSERIRLIRLWFGGTRLRSPRAQAAVNRSPICSSPTPGRNGRKGSTRYLRSVKNDGTSVRPLDRCQAGGKRRWWPLARNDSPGSTATRSRMEGDPPPTARWLTRGGGVRDEEIGSETARSGPTGSECRVRSVA